MGDTQFVLNPKSEIRNRKSPGSALVELLAVVTIIGILTSLPVGRALAAPPTPGYALTWSDEFNGISLDPSKWWHDSLGPRRDAINVTNAVAVGNGNLTITTYTENGQHYTGFISTWYLFEQKYGFFEARIQFNDSPGEWSAFWMGSPTMGNPIGNAAVAGTEIDIVEHNNTSNRVTSAVHWDGYGADHKWLHYTSPNLGLASGFHLYGLAWDPSGYRFYIDDILRYSISQSSAISQRTEYLLLTSEVEGTVPAGGYGSLAASTTKMTVDYVRVYSAVPEPSTLVLLGIGGLSLLAYTWRKRK